MQISRSEITSLRTIKRRVECI